jgi:hypothetical protein
MKRIGGRLALRRECCFWNAYYAADGTMEGAVFIGSILISAVKDNPERKNAFLHIMFDAVADLVEKETGIRPTTGEIKAAPEHERTGNA